jgi:hypothetical protein
MKIEINKTATITCENQREIAMLQMALQAAIVHATLNAEELNYIETLERKLLA